MIGQTRVSYTSDALFGAPGSAGVTEYGQGYGGQLIAAPAIAVLPWQGAGWADVAPAGAGAASSAPGTFGGLTLADLRTGGGGFWRSEAAGFLYFLTAAVILNARLVNRR